MKESATAPPKLVVLVYQRFAFAKAAEIDQWEVGAARACQGLDVPNSWIVMDSVTGEPEALSFDPFDSFGEMEKPVAEWGAIYAAHPELGRLQAQIMTALTSQRTVIAVRRDDLSYRAARIDLSKARFMRVLEVRLHPGREKDFAEAFGKLSAAYEKARSDLPWVVYQVNLGTPSPTFLAFVPMRALGRTTICCGRTRRCWRRRATRRSACRRLRGRRTRAWRAIFTRSSRRSRMFRRDLRRGIWSFGGRERRGENS